MQASVLNQLSSDTTLVRALLAHFSKQPESQKALLSECPELTPKRLFMKSARIGLSDQLSILGRMREEKGDTWFYHAPGFWELALNNIFCSAVRTAPDLNAALQVLARYGFLWSPALFYQKISDSDSCYLTVETIQLNHDDPVPSSGLESLKIMGLIGAYILISDVVTDQWLNSSIYLDNAELTFPAQSFFTPQVQSRPGLSGIKFPPGAILSQNPQSDPIKFRKLTSQLQNLLQPTHKNKTIVETVTAFMDAAQNYRPSLKEVSRSMGMSERTLNRRLEAEGQSFRRLLEASLKRRTQILLAHGTMSRGEIAERLGYKDQASFSRALQRWNLA